jgi:5-formyltetrahydrofolate cyclo-ligase
MNSRSQNGLTIGERKQALRAELRNSRNVLSEAARREKSLLIGQRLRSLALYRQAGTVMFFVTHGSEVFTEDAIETAWKDDKQVAVPLVDAQQHRLKAALIRSLETDLAYGMYSIREPKLDICRMVTPDAIDLVLVPALGFDKNGNRIGYGKGFYDTWLQQFPVEKRIGLAFDFQIVQAVPVEEHDIPVGAIVTEQRIITIDQK